jgi:secretin/TonB-like protein
MPVASVRDGGFLVRAAAWAAISLWLIGSARAEEAADMNTRFVQIEPEELRLALPTLGGIEGLNMVFLSEDLGNRKTYGISGNFSSPEALEQLLRGTDLTYRFLDRRTVMIVPARELQGAPAGRASEWGSADDPVNAATPVGAGLHLAQVTVTATRPSDTGSLDYFRLLDAMAREKYQRLARSLPFTDAGTVRFPGSETPGHRLTLGHHMQAATVDGIVVSRLFNFTLTQAEAKLQVHNNNNFPVFVEIDLLKTALGDGAYVALAPGETAFWSWPPTVCVTRGIVFRVLPAQCYNYSILGTTAHVWTLKGRPPAEL